VKIGNILRKKLGRIGDKIGEKLEKKKTHFLLQCHLSVRKDRLIPAPRDPLFLHDLLCHLKIKDDQISWDSFQIIPGPYPEVLAVHSSLVIPCHRKGPWARLALALQAPPNHHKSIINPYSIQPLPQNSENETKRKINKEIPAYSKSDHVLVNIEPGSP